MLFISGDTWDPHPSPGGGSAVYSPRALGNSPDPPAGRRVNYWPLIPERISVRSVEIISWTGGILINRVNARLYQLSLWCGMTAHISSKYNYPGTGSRIQVVTARAAEPMYTAPMQHRAPIHLFRHCGGPPDVPHRAVTAAVFLTSIPRRLELPLLKFTTLRVAPALKQFSRRAISLLTVTKNPYVCNLPVWMKNGPIPLTVVLVSLEPKAVDRFKDPVLSRARCLFHPLPDAQFSK